MPLATLIDVPALTALLAAGEAVPVDCRFDLADPDAGRRAWREAHLPGAAHADLAADLSASVTPASGRHPLPDPNELAHFWGGLGIGEDTPVVVYDQSNGSFAARAWWLLRWLGHRKVAVLDGGFAAWVAAGGKRDSAEPKPRRRTFKLHSGLPEMPWVATAADVLAAAADPRCRVVDARAPERFAGAVEPIDPVAGHVPGAVNHPFAANLGADGRFLPADELRRRWSATLAGVAPAAAIVMCGSGVTACHDLLALEHAGLAGARLYAGSWSEWIRDPERPVVRG